MRTFVSGDTRLAIPAVLLGLDTTFPGRPTLPTGVEDVMAGGLAALSPCRLIPVTYERVRSKRTHISDQKCCCFFMDTECCLTCSFPRLFSPLTRLACHTVAANMEARRQETSLMMKKSADGLVRVDGTGCFRTGRKKKSVAKKGEQQRVVRREQIN